MPIFVVKWKKKKFENFQKLKEQAEDERLKNARKRLQANYQEAENGIIYFLKLEPF